MRKTAFRRITCLSLLFIFSSASTTTAQNTAVTEITLSVPEPSKQYFHVKAAYTVYNQQQVILKMPNWTPGYYQLMNYADKVVNFKAYDQEGELPWKKINPTSWKIDAKKGQAFAVSYDVKATHNFVAGNFVNEERAYISPAGAFLYPEGRINSSVTVAVKPSENWKKVATGLTPLKSETNAFFAADFDILFDSPILMGNLDSFPSFKVNNKPHYFFAYKPGNFNRQLFMNDLQKIVTTASGIIGDIPYNDYSFLAIGPGGGGIEHLNSTSVAFNGTGLDTSRKAKLKLYSFLSHEYFHHYNVKRIRPVELGPFDYDQGSRTKMLWLSEGVTVYYEPIILSRSRLLTEEEMLAYFSMSIYNYETKPGRQFQTPADASYHTWEEGPFGRTGDEVNKTISPYDKGAILGMLLDFKIRHESGNKRSLDDLMKLLYNKYYKKEGRGFTEDEFKKEAEKMAGASLGDFFDYIYTLKKVEYNTYLNYAGLQADVSTTTLPGNWTGLHLRDRNDSLLVTDVEWQSPAWNAGLRKGNTFLTVNAEKMNAAGFLSLLERSKKEAVLTIRFYGKNGESTANVPVTSKKIIPYTISKIPDPSPLQQAILSSWMKGK